MSAAPCAASFTLPYRPPFDWPAMLAFLARRTVAGVERVDGERYLRSASIAQGRKRVIGWLSVAHDARRHQLAVTLSPQLDAVKPAIEARLAHVFDIGCDPNEVARALGALARNPGLRVPGTFDGFEAAVRAILGQQVTVRAAHTIAGRFAAAFGKPVDGPDGVTVAFPTARDIARLDPVRVAELGVVMQRARAIVAMAQALSDGSLVLDPSAQADASIEALQGIPGIGPWTAQYIAMRALRCADAFPHTDYGVRKALGDCTATAALRQAERWRPWRAYAVMHLWKSLEEPA